MASIDDLMGSPTANGGNVFQEIEKRRREQAVLRATMAHTAAQDLDPAQIASDLKLSTSYSALTGKNVPPEAMSPTVRQTLQSQLVQANLQRIAKDNVNSANYLSDPANAALSYDDLSTVGFWGGLGNKLVGGTEQFGAAYKMQTDTGLLDQQRELLLDKNRSFSDILRSEQGKQVGPIANALDPYPVRALGRYIASRFASGLDAVTDPLLGTDNAERIKQNQAAMQKVLQAYGETTAQIEKNHPGAAGTQQVRQQVAAIDPQAGALDTLKQYFDIAKNDPAGFLDYTLESAAQSLPPLAIAALTTAATKKPSLGLAAMGAASYPTAYAGNFAEQAQARGYDLTKAADVKAMLSDPTMVDQMKTKAGAYAAVTSVVNALGGGLVTQQLVHNPLGEILLQSIAQAVVGSGAEVLARVASNQPIHWPSVVEEGLVSFAMAPLEVVGVGRRTFFDRMSRMQAAEARRSVFEAIAKTGEESKLKGRSAEKYGEMVSELTKDGPIEHVYVSPESMDEMFQKAKITPEQFFDRISELSIEDFRAAQRGGFDFEMPTSVYAAKIVGSKLEPALAEHIKFGPMEMSMAEATNLRSQIDQHVKDLQTTVEQVQQNVGAMGEDAQTQYDKLVRDLTMSGRAPDVAAREALPIIKFAETRAQRAGMPLGDFLKQYAIPRIYRVREASTTPGAAGTKIELAPMVKAMVDPTAELPPVLRNSAAAIRNRLASYTDLNNPRDITPEMVKHAASDAAAAGELSAPLGDEFYMAPGDAPPTPTAGSTSLNENAAPYNERGLAPDGSVDRTVAEENLKRAMDAIQWHRKNDPAPEVKPLELADFKGFPITSFKRDGWFIFSTPDVMDAEQRLSRMHYLGVDFKPLKGVYKGQDDGTSFLVTGPRELGEALGRLYRQESILDKRGIVFTDGRPDAPIPFDYVITGGEAAFEDFHSIDPQTGEPFSLHLLWPDYFGPKLPDLEASSPGPVPAIRDLATRYMVEHNLPVRHQKSYVKVDVDRAKHIAAAYDRMKDQPNKPEVKAAYEALAKETLAQYEALLELGYKFEWIKGEDPYTSPRDAIIDMRDNKHLWVFPTEEGFGTQNEARSDHPLLAQSGYFVDGREALVNDLFRIVHDVFGHGMEGAAFGPRGEENAWQAHVRMFSPEAARAMTTETRGQNSWVNYGPHGEANRANPKDTIFADQKTGLLPKWVSEVGIGEDQTAHLPQASDGRYYGVPLRDGKLVMTHWGDKALDVIDPAKAGTGPLRGAERLRGGVEGSYYGLAIGTPNGYRKEALGPYRHEVSVDPKRYYPLHEDPMNLKSKARASLGERYSSADFTNAYEQAIKDAGYDGYIASYSPIGATAKSFVPLKPESVGADTTFYQSRGMPQPVFKSELANQVSMAKQETATAKDWRSIVPKLPGVKASEIAWTGVDAWLESLDPKQQVTRDALYEWITQNGVDVRVTTNAETPLTGTGWEIADGSAGVKFRQYVELGDATNYREWLFTVPNLDALPLNVGAEPFKFPAHWDDDTNVVVHMRTTDRDAPEGGKALFVEEVQSDLNNTIRKENVPTDLAARRIAAGNASEALPALRTARMEMDKAYETRTSMDLLVGEARARVKTARERLARAVRDAVSAEVLPKADAGEFSRAMADVTIRVAMERTLSVTSHPDYRAELSGKEVLDLLAASLDSPAYPSASAGVREADPTLGLVGSADLLQERSKERLLASDNAEKARIAYALAERAYTDLQAHYNIGVDPIPLNPFAEASAVELAMKQALREAAQNGYDRLSWTPATMQGRRWGQRVSKGGTETFEASGYTVRASEDAIIISFPGPEGDDLVKVFVAPSGRIIASTDASLDTGKVARDVAAALTGRNIADVPALGDLFSAAKAKGTDISVDRLLPIKVDTPPEGTGYINVYDRQIKKFVEKFAQKNGSKVDVSTVNGEEVWSVPITDQMREAAMQPFALFQQDGGEKRGSIILPPTNANGEAPSVNLFAHADLSTVLHEGGHWFLWVLQAMSEKGEASSQHEMEALKRWWFDNADGVAKDAGVGAPQVRKYLKDGTTGDSDIDAKINIGLHEQFARGLEAYYMEGKAPSNVLRAAFESFTAWLLSIYKRAKGLNVNLNDEVRSVFDRLLATDEEIAKAKEEYRPSDTEIAAAAKEMGLDEESYRKLAELTQEARDEARQSMLREVMAPVRAARTAEQQAERAALRQKITDEVMSQRANRVVQWLGSGKWHGGDAPEGVAGTDLRLDRKLTADEYGEHILHRLPRGRREIVKNGTGVTADDIAGFFGYRTGAEMIDDLVTAPRAADEIRARVDAAMRDKYGDTLVDGKIQQQAVDALHGEKAGQLIVAELRALNKVGAKGEMTTRSQAAAIARRMIEQMPARKAKSSGTYLAAERRHAEDAARLLAEGKTDEAFAAKRKQLIAHSLYTRSREAAETIGKLERLAGRLRTVSTRKKLAGTYIAAIDEILDTYDFRRISGAEEQRRGALQAYVDMMIREGRENELAIPAAVASRLDRRPYMTLQMNELQGVYDALRNIEHTARFVQKLRDRQAAREMAQVVGEIEGAFGDNIHGKPPSRRPGTMEKIRDASKDFVNLATNALTILRRIDGWGDRGAAVRGIFDSVHEAGVWELARREEAAVDIEKLYDVYTKAERRQMGRPERIAGVKDMMSKWDRISVALNTGNADNFDRLTSIDARSSYSKGEVDAILATLDARDWRFVQSVWDYIDTWWKPISEREERTTGLRPRKVEPEMMVQAPEFVRGGYYPIVYDPRFNAEVAAENTEELLINMRAGRFGKAQTKNGHLKERAAGGGGRSVRIGMEVFHKHIVNVIHDLAFSEGVNNSWRVLHDPSVRRLFEENGMQGDYASLEVWLQDVATGEVRSADILSRVARHAKSGYTLSKLAFNVSTVLLQITGMAQTFAGLGSEATTRGIIRTLRDPEMAATKIKARSAFMRERETSFHKDIYDMSRLSGKELGFDQGRLGEAKALISKVGFYAMQKAQFYFADVPTWVAAYDDGMRKGMSDEEAGKHADLMVARLQTSGLWADRTPIERGSTSRTSRNSDFIRLLTTLGSYMFAKFNVAQEIAGRTARDVTGVNTQSLLALMKGTVDMAMLFTVEAVLAGLVRGQLPGQMNEQDKEWSTYVAKNTLLTMMGTVPIVRDAASLAQGYSGSAYEGILDTFIKTVAATQSKKPSAKTISKDLINAFGILVPGVPSTAINRVIEAEYQRQTDGSVSPLGYIFGLKPKR